MINKIKNVIIYIFVIICIFLSFKMPEILFKLEDIKTETKVYEKEKYKNTIDVETEKIYLVKAINDMESDASQVAINASQKKWVVESQFENDIAENPLLQSENDTEFIPDATKKQLLKLKEFNVLQFNTDENVKCNVTLISKTYKCKENYTIDHIFFNLPNELYNIEMEEKTGKILFINFAKENLFDESTKEEVLINYVKYLDLYIIDDWHYEDNMLKSDKAGLVVSLMQNGSRYILTIHSIEKISNNVIYKYDSDTK